MGPDDLDHDVTNTADHTTDLSAQAELQTLEEMLHHLPPLPEVSDTECQQLIEQAQQIARQARPGRAREADLAASLTTATLNLQALGHYKLLAKLGEGGMGAVYRALHTKLDKQVALKVLPAQRMQDADAVARFEREMRAVGKLTHENIVAAHDAGEIEGTHYLVMELVHGVDLGSMARTMAPLPVAESCEIIRQAARGLQHAFENNLVHRDIKPSNLMLAAGPNGPVVKILDMGLALLDEQHAEHPELTASGQIMGTLDYMAPEQAGDTHTVDIRADIYSLGATLYKLLTGRVPFQGPQYASTIKKLTALATQDPPRIDSMRDDLPAGLVEVVHRMLARVPEDRYATPGDVAAAIAPFSEGANLAALLDAAANTYGNAEATVLLQTAAKAAESVNVRSSVVDTQSQMVPARGHRSAAQTVGTTQPPRRFHRGLLLIGGAVPIVLLLGAILFSLRTPHGEIVVELADGIPAEAVKNLKIEVTGAGQLKVADAAAGWSIDVAEGKYQARLSGGADQFQLEQNQVTVTRGQTVLLKVALKPLDAAQQQHAGTTPSPSPSPQAPQTWQPTPEQQAFFDHVAPMSAEQQVDAVSKKLREVNPDFDGEIQHKIKDGQVVTFSCRSVRFVHIWPVRAFRHLKELSCGYTASPRSTFSDLSPLQGMALNVLDCSGSRVADLSPLRGMPLRLLNCHATNISDLSPLRGAPLTRLHVSRSRVEDLTPLIGMQLTHFDCHGTKVKDLELLKGMPLIWLECGSTSISDLSPLKGMALVHFACDDTPVEDLSPLAGMPLTLLDCGDTKVRDLSLLSDMPLRYLLCWRTDVTDLSPLKRKRLLDLQLQKTPIADLSVLVGMPLQKLAVDIRLFDETDFALIQSLPITQLNGQQQVVDQLKALEARRQEVQTFAEETHRLPPAEQIKAVAARLDALNGAGAVRLHAQLGEDGITSLLVSIKEHYRRNARDINPLMAFKQLKKLQINGGEAYMDLSFIRFFPLEELHCNDWILFKNVTSLKKISTLKRVNDYPADEYLEYVAQEGLRHFARPKLPPMPWDVTPEQQAFFDHVAPLQADEQAEAVARKLMELNPGFDGKCEYATRNGQVTEFKIHTDGITAPTVDLWPVRAFPALKVFWCRGSAITNEHGTYRGKAVDLNQLRGMRLSSLSIKDAPIEDLSPLQGMPLTHLACYRTAVADLSPLRDLPLENLQYDVRLFDEQDEALLRALPLQSANGDTRVDVPVEEFLQELTQRRDAAKAFVAEASQLPPAEQVAAVRERLDALNRGNPVRLNYTPDGDKLTELEVYLTGRNSDLTPLMALTHLKQLVLHNCLPWEDLSCLKFLPLEELTCAEETAYKNHRTLRSIQSLRAINGMPATEFWQKLGLAPK